MPKRTRRLCILVGVFGFLLGLVLYIGSQCAVSRRSRTLTTMSLIRRQVEQYYRENGNVPVDLSFLGKGSRILRNTDAWGNIIVYRKLGDGRAELTSFGRDGIPGGTEQGKDIHIMISVVSPMPGTRQSEFD